MRYRLIAIDLDGTLLCPDGKVSEENRLALHAAHEAGAIILPCTGRGWREAYEVLPSVPDGALGVFNTGAMVCGLRQGDTRNRAVFEVDTAKRLIDVLSEGDEAVLAFLDPEVTGYEYIVTGKGEPTRNTKWWFEHNGLRWARLEEVDPGVLEHMIRIGAMAYRHRADEIGQRVGEVLPGQTEYHAFEAVQEPGDTEPMFILECFAKGVNKWRGIEWVAAQHGIKADEISVIGDQINDVPMFEEASCAVAMGNAIDAIKDAAHYHTLPNYEHGVAHAIEKMLAGDW